MKRWSLWAAVCLAALVLNGCILWSSPSGAVAALDAGDTLTFQVVTLPVNSTVKWYLDNTSVASGKTYVYQPTTAQIGLHSITVVATDWGSGNEAKTWLVTVLAP